MPAWVDTVARLVQRRTPSAFGTCRVETRVRLPRRHRRRHRARSGRAIPRHSVRRACRSDAARFLRPRAPVALGRCVRRLRSRAGTAAGQDRWRGFARAPRASTKTVCILNVFAPTEASEPLPVFVWIYGGGFIHGDGADPLFDGSNLAAAGSMVVVTINYRLGVWGFVPVRERNVGLARPDRRAGVGEAQHRARSAATPAT